MGIRTSSSYSLGIGAGATVGRLTATITLIRLGAAADLLIRIIRTIIRFIGARNRNRRSMNRSSRRRRARWRRRQQRLFWSLVIRSANGWRMGLSWYSRKPRKLAL